MREAPFLTVMLLLSCVFAAHQDGSMPMNAAAAVSPHPKLSGIEASRATRAPISAMPSLGGKAVVMGKSAESWRQHSDAQRDVRQAKLHQDLATRSASASHAVAAKVRACVQGFPCDVGNEWTCVERCGCAWTGSACIMQGINTEIMRQAETTLPSSAPGADSVADKNDWSTTLTSDERAFAPDFVGDYQRGVRVLMTSLLRSKTETAAGTGAGSGAESGKDLPTEYSKYMPTPETVHGQMQDKKQTVIALVCFGFVLVILYAVNLVVEQQHANDKGPRNGHGDTPIVHNNGLIIAMMLIYFYAIIYDMQDLSPLFETFNGYRTKATGFVGDVAPGAKGQLIPDEDAKVAADRRSTAAGTTAVASMTTMAEANERQRPQTSAQQMMLPVQQTLLLSTPGVSAERTNYFFDRWLPTAARTQLLESYNSNTRESGGALTDALVPPALRVGARPIEALEVRQAASPTAAESADGLQDPSTQPGLLKSRYPPEVVVGTSLVCGMVIFYKDLFGDNGDITDGIGVARTDRLHPVVLAYFMLFLLLLQAMYLLILRPLLVTDASREGGAAATLPTAQFSPSSTSSYGPQSIFPISSVLTLIGG